jgi:hypothetical protein
MFFPFYIVLKTNIPWNKIKAISSFFSSVIYNNVQQHQTPRVNNADDNISSSNHDSIAQFKIPPLGVQ